MQLKGMQGGFVVPDALLAFFLSPVGWLAPCHVQMHRGAAEEAEGAYQALLDLERRSQGRVVSSIALALSIEIRGVDQQAAAVPLGSGCSHTVCCAPLVAILVGAVTPFPAFQRWRQLFPTVAVTFTSHLIVFPVPQMSRPVSAVTRVLAPLLLQEWRVRTGLPASLHAASLLALGDGWPCMHRCFQRASKPPAPCRRLCCSTPTSSSAPTTFLP